MFIHIFASIKVHYWMAIHKYFAHLSLLHSNPYYSCLWYSFYYSEYRSTFDNNEKFFRYLNTPAILLFVCDIFINLNTSLYQDGVFIENPKEIRAIYYKSHFVIDIISILGIIAYEVLQFTQQF